MRTTGRLLAGWADPAAVFELLVPGGVDAALLEATDAAGESILALGRGLLSEVPNVALAGGDDLRFEPGWIGWLSYEGEARFLEVDRALAFDHPAGTVRALAGDAEWIAAAQSALTRASRGGEGEGEGEGAASVAGPPRAEATWRHSDAQYLRLIAACQEAISRGDAYVLCLTDTATVRHPVDGWTAYRRLRRTSPTHSAGYLRLGGTELVSASPERFLEVTAGGTARSSPIKGTRPRDPDADRDRALAEELGASEKERAENLMIVDLVRNDLSRVAQVGTVRVPQLFEVESYPQVHQLVSTVEAELAPGRTAADVVRALFPAGSMTGAPKASAMALLAHLEQGPRGIYSGVFGYVSSTGAAALAMVIRSIVIEGGVATVGAGGGITALSDPRAELEEKDLKAAALLAALGLRRSPLT